MRETVVPHSRFMSASDSGMRATIHLTSLRTDAQRGPSLQYCRVMKVQIALGIHMSPCAIPANESCVQRSAPLDAQCPELAYRVTSGPLPRNVGAQPKKHTKAVFLGPIM